MTQMSIQRIKEIERQTSKRQVKVAHILQKEQNCNLVIIDHMVNSPSTERQTKKALFPMAQQNKIGGLKETAVANDCLITITKVSINL